MSSTLFPGGLVSLRVIEEDERKPPTPPPFQPSGGAHLEQTLHTGRGVTQTPRDPLSGFMGFADSERTHLETPHRPLVPVLNLVGSKKMIEHKRKHHGEQDVAQAFPALVVAPPTSTSPSTDTLAPGRSAMGSTLARLFGGRKSRSQVDVVKPPPRSLPPVHLESELDKVVVVKAMGSDLLNSLARLKAREAGILDSAGKAETADMIEHAQEVGRLALGSKSGSTQRSAGVVGASERLLMPEGLENLCKGATPDSFELALPRLSITLPALEAYLNEYQARVVSTKKGEGESQDKGEGSLIPLDSSTRTGRNCGCTWLCFKCSAFLDVDPCGEGREGRSDFASYGPGLVLYFKLLKSIGWVLLGVWIALLPPLYAYSQGGAYSGGLLSATAAAASTSYTTTTTVGTAVALAGFTAGALGDASNFNNPTYLASLNGTALLNHFTIKPESSATAWNDSRFLALMVCFHLIGAAFFACAICSVRQGGEKEIEEFQGRYLAADAYGVELSGLPPTATATEVLEYMNTQILREGEEVVQVGVAVNYGGYLALSARRLALSARVEALESQLGRIYARFDLTLSADTEDIARVAALVAGKREKKRSAIHAAQVKMREAKRDILRLEKARARMKELEGKAGAAAGAAAGVEGGKDRRKEVVEEEDDLTLARHLYDAADHELQIAEEMEEDDGKDEAVTRTLREGKALSGRKAHVRVSAADAWLLPHRGLERQVGRLWRARARLLLRIAALGAKAASQLSHLRAAGKAWVLMNSSAHAARIVESLRAGGGGGGACGGACGIPSPAARAPPTGSGTGVCTA